MLIEFDVPAVPVGQPRPRATNAGAHARIHEVTHVGKASEGTRRPHPIVAFKATVRLAAQQAYQGPPLREPLRMSLVFVLPRGTNKFWKTRPTPRYPHIARPDIDNLAKAVLDSLNQIVFKDDSQIYAITASKWCAAGDEAPHVEVLIETRPEWE